MIIFDTETTGLPKAGGTLNQQPKIIEFAAIKIDENLEIKGEFEALVNPGEPLDPFIVKLTGITDEKLKDKPPFAGIYLSLCEFFLGETTMLSHNLPFDRDMMRYDLHRLSKVSAFPWPSNHLCSIELTRHLKKKKLKMVDLYKLAFGKELDQKHRAMDDVMALFEIVKWMKEQKILTEIK